MRDDPGREKRAGPIVKREYRSPHEETCGVIQAGSRGAARAAVDRKDGSSRLVVDAGHDPVAGAECGNVERRIGRKDRDRGLGENRRTEGRVEWQEGEGQRPKQRNVCSRHSGNHWKMAVRGSLPVAHVLAVVRALVDAGDGVFLHEAATGAAERVGGG